MAEETWYYEKDGVQHGPIPESELKALIERGEISRTNLAWRPGEKDWTETGTFEHLMPAFRTPPPVPPSSKGEPPPIAPPSTGPGHEDLPRPEAQGESLRTKTVRWLSKLGGMVWRLWLESKQRPAKSTGAAAIMTAIVVLLSLPPDDPRADSKTTAPTIVPTSLAGTRVPSDYTGPVGQLKIDAYPWSELTSLETNDGPLAVPGVQQTPLVLLVPPGTYRVRLQGIEQDCVMTVAIEQSKRCVRIRQSVDAAAYYREVGW